MINGSGLHPAGAFPKFTDQNMRETSATLILKRDDSQDGTASGFVLNSELHCNYSSRICWRHHRRNSAKKCDEANRYCVD